MAGGSVETTLELWASALRDVKGRIRLLFSQDRVAASASQFLDGLLSAHSRDRDHGIQTMVITYSRDRDHAR